MSALTRGSMCLRRAINLTQLGIQCAAGALNAVLTGTVGLTSKRSLIVRFTVSGPVPCSGAQAPGQGAGRSQHRVKAAQPP